ncbi:DUF3592 domain-containing protein [Cronobacter turicensis]|uniref:DUF3592 domain-containing protein n=1 Tax=Cronobacter turicensis TaxID=413502 RepID=UPI000CFACC98|nr:DUF3592 domain-containing protein [Cronobacter turicensis]
MGNAFLIILGALLVLVIIFGGIAFKVTKEQNFKASAVRVDGHIIGMKYSGSSDTGNILYKITVKFNTPKGEVTAVDTAFLSPEHMIYVKDHKSIPTYYSKENPKKILIAAEDIPNVLNQ